jgi:NRPS condensation-like uncharacterized protein
MKYNSKAQKIKIKATQLEIFFDHMSSICDLYLNVIIDLPKKINLQRLIQAMSLIAVQEPRISARYIREGYRSYWKFEKNPDWDIEEIFSSDEITEYAPELITNPPHPEGNFPISIRLIHFHGRDRLHVRINHILTDGGGTKEFIYMLASAYRKIQFKPEINSNTSLWTNRQLLGLGKYLKTYPIGLLVAGLILDKKSLLLPADYFAVPMKICKKSEGRIILLHLNSDRVFRLKNSAGIKNATINDILLTAFSRALSNCFAAPTNIGKQFGVIVTADMRGYIDWERSLCTLSNTRILKLGTLPLRGRSDLLDDVIRLTTQWKKNLAGLGNFLFNMIFLKCNSGRSIRFLVNKLIKRDQQAKVCRIVFTNLGLLDPKKIDFGDGPCSNAFILPAIGTPPYLIAGASGCADKICFSIGYKSGSLPTDSINKLIDELDRELYLLERIE